MVRALLQNSLPNPAKDALRACRSALPVVLRQLRSGRPDLILRFDGGIGDDLICSALIRELQVRRRRRIWMMTSHPELFEGNPDIDFAPRKGVRGVRLALKMLGLKPIYLSYALNLGDRDLPPRHHVISELARSLELTGRIKRRPYLPLSPQERSYGAFSPRQIAIQTSGLSARYPAATKEWFPERFQQVVDHFRGRYEFVQVGSARDPLLLGVTDLRGRTSIRQTAAVLSNSLLFVGLAGFLQHLARAVECRAVIVYGGRELPEQTGYLCHENVVQRPACSPCWISRRCDHDVKCMAAVSAGRVIEATERQLALAGVPLSEDLETLPWTPSAAQRSAPAAIPTHATDTAGHSRPEFWAGLHVHRDLQTARSRPPIRGSHPSATDH